MRTKFSASLLNDTLRLILILIISLNLKIGFSQVSTNSNDQFDFRVTLDDVNDRVNTSTGALNYSLPMGQVSGLTTSIPISLNYHSSGIKVEQKANWVGLGWSLDIPYSIHRNVVGLPDNAFDESGYLFGGAWNSFSQMSGLFNPLDDITEGTFEFPIEYFTNPQTGVPNVEQFSGLGLTEFQPDEYQISVPGYSGMFLIDPMSFVPSQPLETKTFNGRTFKKFNILLIPSSDIEVWLEIPDFAYSSDLDIESFLVVSNDRSMWLFEALGHSAVVSSHEPHALEYRFRHELLEQKNDFYLTKVFSSYGELEIELEYYVSNSPSFTMINIGDDSNIQYSVNLIAGFNGITRTSKTYLYEFDFDSQLPSTWCGPPLNSDANEPTTSSYTPIVHPRLIKSRFGIMSFNRSSIQRLDEPFDYSLSEIVFQNNLGEEISRTKFEYIYLGSNSNCERLMLTALNLVSNIGEEMPLRRFEYFDDVLLPDYDSKQIDFWGYFNGFSNSTLIPPYNGFTTLEETAEYNRKPNMLFGRSQSLKKVIEGSGKVISFLLEQNTYGSLRGDQLGVVKQTGGLRVGQIVESTLNSDSETHIEIEYQRIEDGVGASSGILQFEPRFLTRSTSLVGAVVGARNVLGEVYPFYSNYNCFSSKISSRSEYFDLVSSESNLYYEVVFISVENQGKAVSYFQKPNFETTAFDFPYLPISNIYNPVRLVKTELYKNPSQLIESIVYTYDNVLPTRGRKRPVVGCRVMRVPDSESMQFRFKEYSYTEVLDALIKVESTIFDDDDETSQRTQTKEISYCRAPSLAVRKEVSRNTGLGVRDYSSLKRYVGDFEISISPNDDMTRAINAIHSEIGGSYNWPVEELFFEGDNPSTGRLIGGKIITYKIVENKVVSDEVFVLDLYEPIDFTNFTPCDIVNGFFLRDNRYRSVSKTLEFDADASLVSATGGEGIVQSVLRDKVTKNIVAEVYNARKDEVAFTSFEDNDTNGWLYDIEGVTLGSGSLLGMHLNYSKTGINFYDLSNGIIRGNVGVGKYTLSFWLKSDSGQPTINFNGSLIEVFNEGPDNEGWKYYEYSLENDSGGDSEITIDGIGWIDELRMYPSDASMRSVAYNVDGTIRSSIDVNNRVATYLYDSWRRLQWSLDENWQIRDFNEYYIRSLLNINDRSWISHKTINVEGLTFSDVQNSAVYSSNVSLAIRYLDDLGRVTQDVAVRRSTNATRDIVRLHVYDETGRESRNYLPFCSPSFNDGEYLENATNIASSFYLNTPHVAHTDYPFSDTRFEESPVGKVIEQGHVGVEGQLGNNHTIAIKHLLNNEGEVLLWELQGSSISAMDGGSARYYPVNSLLKRQTTNEQGNVSWEFVNAIGQVVCRRSTILVYGSNADFISMYRGNGEIQNEVLSNLTEIEGSEVNLDTYFIYDALGRLVTEIPPIAVISCIGNYIIGLEEGTANFEIFDGYLTFSVFDQRGRLVELKKPGEAWSFFVYNRMDQVVLIQTPLMVGENWKFLKYDVNGRVIQTGLYQAGPLREIAQAEVDAFDVLWEKQNDQGVDHYTNYAYPTSDIEVLTEVYYDNYDFDINEYTIGFGSSCNLTPSRRIVGFQTGSKIKVLNPEPNEEQFLTSVNYFNEFGLPIVSISEGILGGFDKVVSEFDFLGRIRHLTRDVRIDSQGGDIVTVKYSFSYDVGGNLVLVKHRIGNNPEIGISKLQYNALGQLVKKHLHVGEGANLGMQTIDYRYNERGWLTKINNSDLTNDGDNLESYDVFGEELVYFDESRYYSEVLSFVPRFDGNVAAMKWKTNRSPEIDAGTLAGHSYVYRYDRIGQLIGAFYASSSDVFIDNYSSNVHMWDERFSYDMNGNVRSLKRNRGRDENGAELGSPLVVDALRFSYYNNSNKLKRVFDEGVSNWISPSASKNYSHFIDLIDVDLEYYYDIEGRLTRDANKDISFEYNNLNLVTKAMSGQESVDFSWDALGNKWKKKVGTDVIYYMNGIEIRNGSIVCIPTMEGIVRPANPSSLEGQWYYDYYIKDHLGNVRAVVTNENSSLVEEKVTVELERRFLEEEQFDNVSLTEMTTPFAYPIDPDDPTSLRVAQLSAETGKMMGPAKVMEVKAGEKIDLSVKYWYTEEVDAPITSISEVIISSLLNLQVAAAGVIPLGPENGISVLGNPLSDQYTSFSSFLNQSLVNVDFAKPQAFLVYVTFDLNMRIDPGNSGVIQVGDANALIKLEKEGILPRKDGYFYTFLTNRSRNRVNFDNLRIKRWAPQVRVVYDYYPHGLTWDNPSSPNTSEGIHDLGYQGKEFQFQEFSNGKGLALYDFHARMYDPTIGRWLVPDPLQEFFSPYLAMGNSPTRFTDPTGMSTDIWVGIYNESTNTYVWDYYPEIETDEQAKARWGEKTKSCVECDIVISSESSGMPPGTTVSLLAGGTFLPVYSKGVDIVGERNQKSSGNSSSAGGTVSSSIDAPTNPNTRAYADGSQPSSGGHWAYELPVETWIPSLGRELEAYHFNSDFQTAFAFYEEMGEVFDAILVGITVDAGMAMLTAGIGNAAYGGLARIGSFADDAAKTGGRVFWSGGNVAKNAAADFAAANGMKTLEMTTKGRIMNSISPYLPKSISRPIWNNLSSNFAKGASGNINVFQNAAGVGLNSTWRMVEYPILQNQNIIYHIVK